MPRGWAGQDGLKPTHRAYTHLKFPFYLLAVATVKMTVTEEFFQLMIAFFLIGMLYIIATSY